MANCLIVKSNPKIKDIETALQGVTSSTAISFTAARSGIAFVYNSATSSLRYTQLTINNVMVLNIAQANSGAAFFKKDDNLVVKENDGGSYFANYRYVYLI